ncbi:YtxH domain-containing protein [Oceanobacillus sp. FSL K6-2867]|uniref:YtxH domain-containing protein n=1 Tax=Oceanobacillus sp. FSL K6-2867 TaxID=2954748 RepID=UPI0030D7563B
MTEQNKQQVQTNQEEQENRNSSDKAYTKKDVIRGGIIGWGVGVATTLLLAPKSGKELRGDITYQVGSAKDKAVDKSRELTDSAMDKYAAIKENTTNKTIELKHRLTPAKSKQSNGEETEAEDTESNSAPQSNKAEEKQNESASTNKKAEAKSKSSSSSASTRRTPAKRSSGYNQKARTKTASASK